MAAPTASGLLPERDQTLAQMAISWVLRDPKITSALIGASSVQQLEENVAAATAPPFKDDELTAIDRHAVDLGIDLWESSRAGEKVFPI